MSIEILLKACKRAMLPKTHKGASSPILQAKKASR